MVLMPVRSVTVADPPKISIDDTMIFVASLIPSQTIKSLLK